MKIKNYIKPKIVVLAVYKPKDGSWRGFCSPYDIVYTGTNKEIVKEKLIELVECYEDGLKKYGYPSHLSVKKLTDEEDSKLLKKEIIPHISKQLENKMNKDFIKYQKETKTKSFSLDHIFGSYHYPNFA